MSQNFKIFIKILSEWKYVACILLMQINICWQFRFFVIPYRMQWLYRYMSGGQYWGNKGQWKYKIIWGIIVLLERCFNHDSFVKFIFVIIKMPNQVTLNSRLGIRGFSILIHEYYKALFSQDCLVVWIYRKH